MLSRSLRQRLSDLLRQGALFGRAADARVGTGPADTGATAIAEPIASGSRVQRAGIEEILPGGVLTRPDGSIFVHERLYNEMGEDPSSLLERFAALCDPAVGPPPHPNGGDTMAPRKQRRNEHGHANGHAPLVIEPPLANEPRVVYDDPRREAWERIQGDLPGILAQVEWPERGLFRRFGYRRMLFLDIETCGLSGVPVFLIGLALISESTFVLRQLFARDYTEEPALLSELGRLLADVDFLVTFNGKSFDVPFLRDRAVHHRLPLRLEVPHLDLLWMARRRWKSVLPNCKLKTLEWHVLRKRRAGDVWGFEIPGLYHDYVQNGEPHRLIPVFHHNMLDVIAMMELIPAIFDSETLVY